MSAAPKGLQGLRFRKADSIAKADAATAANPALADKATVGRIRKLVKEGWLVEQVGRHNTPPWAPSFSVAFRILILMRMFAAMYSIISDCDEVYNYWEPLHYLTYGKGLQPWEYSPVYAIRSWTYILLHVAPVKLGQLVSPLSKRPSFFAVRITYAFISSACEAHFATSVVEHINRRVGRYTLFGLLCSAGMWSASTAFLPTTTSMHLVMLALSFAMAPPSKSRTNKVVAAFAAAVVLGWPFCALLAIPFLIEELALPAVGTNFVENLTELMGQGATWGAAVLVPTCFIDYYFYGRNVLVPLNIIAYNIFSSSASLYGTSPPSYYILNNLLNFPVLFPLALVSLPALAITARFDRKRLAAPADATIKRLLVRLAPLYLWLAVLTAQPHKEERFMFPAFPLVAFNAAVTVYLSRGWLETAFIHYTRSPYRASRTSLFSIWTLSILATACLLSLARIYALHNFYHAPLDVIFHLDHTELPRLALTRFPNEYTSIYNDAPATASGGRPTPADLQKNETLLRHVIDTAHTQLDLAPLQKLDLSICVGKEWHRFPGNFLVPRELGIIKFVKSEYDGQLPIPWLGEGWVEGTRALRREFNDKNKELRDRYVAASSCDYLIDVDFPHRYDSPTSAPPSKLEPRYAVDSSRWERVKCAPFLDAEKSRLLTRLIAIPGLPTDQGNKYGDYCLLRNKKGKAV